jgi:NADPH:quinone reductase-like Zn-dependent oxidoreductase
MPFNTAAWLPAKRATLKVEPAPYTPPGDAEIVVRTHAVAVNPVDWIMQLIGDLAFPFIKYPFILGSDLAGEVVEVGAAVTRFKVGDRVLAHALGSDPQINRAAEGAFQACVLIQPHMASPIPDSLTYAEASVLPLGLSTAACGLFQKDHLALDLPTAKPEPKGRTVLIWGGSTSVGCNAIQLAVAAGYEVITTASPRNFDYVKALGAGQAFDYNSKTVVKDIVAALKGKTIAGAVAIGAGSSAPCLEIVHRCKGVRFVSLASFPVNFAGLARGPGATFGFLAQVPKLVGLGLALAIRSRLTGVRTKGIYGTTLAHNAVGPAIYETFLPAALAEGRFVAAPPPQVVGQGLAWLQAAFEVQKRGVSARKVVVVLEG